jgi:hypothetical protein
VIDAMLAQSVVADWGRNQGKRTKTQSPPQRRKVAKERKESEASQILICSPLTTFAKILRPSCLCGGCFV